MVSRNVSLTSAGALAWAWQLLFLVRDLQGAACGKPVCLQFRVAGVGLPGDVLVRVGDPCGFPICGSAPGPAGLLLPQRRRRVRCQDAEAVQHAGGCSAVMQCRTYCSHTFSRIR